MMDKPMFILGSLASIVGAIVLFFIIPAQHEPPLMSNVSPAFYPNIGTIIFLVGGLGLAVTSLRGKSQNVDPGAVTAAVKFSSLMAVLFAATLAIFQLVNFIAGGIVLIGVSMWLLGERRIHVLALVSLISPVAIWLFIDVLLGRSLP